MNTPAPFTKNQIDYFMRSGISWFNVAEGGKRGGKNVLQVLAFCTALETHPNRLHLIAGVSQATAKLNIIDCDGFGLMNFFEGRCRQGKYNDRSCLFVDTATGEKIILVSGGRKDGDEAYIKGNTYGMAYITEANECHKKFIKEVFDRTLSSRDRKVFHDLNPKDPKHWYYTDVLEHHEKIQKRDAGYGYNYGHFTIADNLSIDDKTLREVLRTYQKGTVWYERDILGRRRSAEGVVYLQFANNPAAYVTTKDDDVQFARIGVDFGGNKSAHAFYCVGFSHDFKRVKVLDEYYLKKEITPEKLENDFCDFVVRNRGKYPIWEARCDSAESTLIKGLQAAVIKRGIAIDIKKAIKGPIIDRIRLINILISLGRFTVMAHCKELIGAMCEAVWDEDEIDDVRLDDGIKNIDSLDAMEYAIEPDAADILALR